MAELWEEELDLGLGTKGAPCLSFPISPEEMCIAPQWKSAAMCALLQPPPRQCLASPLVATSCPQGGGVAQLSLGSDAHPKALSPVQPRVSAFLA